MFCLDFSSSIGQHHLMIQGLVAEHFKLSSIHDWQRNAIKSALQGKDSFIVQPTGSGKSLCYAISSLLAGKVAIVLSPTISLMCVKFIRWKNMVFLLHSLVQLKNM